MRFDPELRDKEDTGRKKKKETLEKKKYTSL